MRQNAHPAHCAFAQQAWQKGYVSKRSCRANRREQHCLYGRRSIMRLAEKARRKVAQAV